MRYLAKNAIIKILCKILAFTRSDEFDPRLKRSIDKIIRRKPDQKA